MHSVASSMFTVCVHCNMDIVIFHLGASADITNNNGETPLQRAEQDLANESDPQKRQCYEKVPQDTHTIKHVHIKIVR